MSKSVLQLIYEDTGIYLGPIEVARDKQLRVFYETWMEAKGDPEKEKAAYESFRKFVFEEYT
jgi:hypothetical protein